MTIKYITLDFNSDGVGDIILPIFDSGNGRNGKLSEEDWKKTLELNQTLLKLCSELNSVQNEIREQGGEISSVQNGGWVTTVLRTLMTLAPVAIKGTKKVVNWIKERKQSSGIMPEQDIDYTLKELRKAYKK